MDTDTPKEDEAPKPFGGTLLPPVPLTARQEELCRRLESLHALYNLPVSPADMFRGAIFASRPECRSNPDWIAQAGNSLREVLYPFYSKLVVGVPDKKEEVLRNYGSVKTDEQTVGRMSRVYNKVQGIAHHGNVEKNHVDYTTFKPEDFDALLAEYEEVIMDCLTRQVDVHADFDVVFAAGVPKDATTI